MALPPGEYERLVDGAVGHLNNLFKEGKRLLILITPGSSRGEVISRLLRSGKGTAGKGVEVLAYGKVAERVQGVSSIEGVQDALSLLKGGGNLRKALEEERVVVFQSTMEALSFREGLRRELKEELGEKETKRLFEKRVEVVFLPRLYGKLLEDIKKELAERAVKVEYREFGSGISLKLLQLAEEEAKRGTEAIKKLSPGRLGLAEWLDKAGVEAGIAMLAAPFGALAYALGSAALAPVISAAFHALDLRSVSDKIAEFVNAFAHRLGADLLREPVKKIAERLLEFASKRGEARNAFLKSLGELLKAVIEAKKYIDDENFEGVVDEVAAQWGLDVDTFKNFVDNLYKLTTAKLVTEEELNSLKELSDEEFKKRIEELIDQRLEPFRKEIEGRLDKIENKLKELREELENLEQKSELEKAQRGIVMYEREHFENGGLYPGIRVKDGRVMIETVIKEEKKEERELVAAGAFLDAAGRLQERLWRDKAVFVVGPKGIGKSTLVAHVIYSLFALRLRGVVKIEPGTTPYELENYLSVLKGFLRTYVQKFGELGDLLLLYDQSYPTTYQEPKAAVGQRIATEDVVKLLVKLAVFIREEGRGRVYLLAVFSEDQFNALREELRRAIKPFLFQPVLNDVEFLARVVEEYASMHLPEARQLAEKIAEFREGYTLIARLVGEDIRQNGVQKAEELLDKAKGDVKLYLAYYVDNILRAVPTDENKTCLKGLGEYGVGKLLAFRQPFAKLLSPGTVLMPASLARLLLGFELSRPIPEKEAALRWLSIRQHDLIEEALSALIDREKVEKIAKGRPELEPWVKVARRLPHIKDAEEAAKRLLTECGGRLVKRLDRRCWRRFALMLGVALADHRFKPLTEGVRELKEDGVDFFEGLLEALEPCGIDEYLLEGGGLTPITLAVLLIREIEGESLSKAYVERHKEIAEELSKLKEWWRERGEFYRAESVYGLGLTVLLADAKRAGMAIGEKAAADALYVVSVAVQAVLRSGAVPYIIDALRPLRDLTPEEWALILLSASQIEGIDSKELREELDAIYSRLMEAGARDWVKAAMAAAYARLYPPDVKRACALLGEIGDEVLKLIAKANVYQAHVVRGRSCPGVNAERELEGIVKQLDETLEKAESGSFKITEELGEYLTRRSPKKPEEALKRELLGAKGFALYASARLKLERDDPKGAADLYENAAEIEKGLENWRSYLVAKSKGVGARLLAEELDVGGLVEAFRGLWGEALEHIELRALYLEIAASTMGKYLVALALNGRLEEAEGLYREHSWWPRSSPIYANVTTRLLASFLGLKTVEAPSDREVLLATISYVYRPLLPAYALSFGVYIGDAADICAETSDSELCIDAHLAVRGNKSAIERIMSRARDLAIELGINIKELEGLDAIKLIQWMAPSNSLAIIILMLRELLRGNYRMARLHALGASKSFKGLPSRLFAEAAEAIERGDEKSLRISLAKLYYFHF
ncbi:MAG: hypothetical protein QW680_09220 [Pyrobaculum sp.]